MSVSIAVSIQKKAVPPPTAQLWKIITDDLSPDWHYRSRTVENGLGQSPAVYGYSPTMQPTPNDFHTDESWLEQAYYALNDYDMNGVRDGLGVDRCRNFLFKNDTALYNDNAGPGFPRRELLTMSGNVLQEIAWERDDKNRWYLKFKTLRLGNSVAGMTHVTHPQYVHRFTIVQFRDGQTITNPKVNRNGYLYYYLVSKDGFAYMPERYVRKVA